MHQIKNLTRTAQLLLLRIGSWSHRPHEVGAQISEDAHGSMAHTANEIVNLL